ncbi:MAG: histidine phosphatase family protein [Acidimicrobiales bacterium]
MATRLVLIRHGETEWSRSERHTGRTDLPLTEAGSAEARLVTGALAKWDFAGCYSSPLVRAHETARLAGFSPELDDDLMEWDYGDAEGKSNDEIVATSQGWSKWHGTVPGGEKVGEVGARADRFIERVAGRSVEGPDAGDLAVFAHGHLLSIMIARWIGMRAADGRRFPLATGSVSVLTSKRADRVLGVLNHRSGNPLPP